jgi:hypothetical protein
MTPNRMMKGGSKQSDTSLSNNNTIDIKNNNGRNIKTP